MGRYVSWKGSTNEYKIIHHHVTRKRGRPKRCEDCGTTDPTKRYEWANLSGDYYNHNDYKRLCKKCHAKMDDNGKIFREWWKKRPLRVGKCETCRSDYKTNTYNRRFCSDACWRKSHNTRQRKTYQSKDYKKIRCEHCHKFFKPIHHNQRFCCYRCSQIWLAVSRKASRHRKRRK